MSPQPVQPSGIQTVDALAGIAAPTLQDYISAASQYVREAGALTQPQKKRGQIPLSNALGRITLAELQVRLPDMRHGLAGEHEVSGALRRVNADVSEIHPLDGLRLAIELKPVLLAVGRAIWNRFGDIRTFAVNLHLKFPFAVVGAVLAIPTWEEVPNPGSGVRRDVTGLMERLDGRLVRARGRETEGDAPHLLEAVAVVVFDPDTGSIAPNVPAAGLRWDQFLQAVASAYQGRFEL